MSELEQARKTRNAKVREHFQMKEAQEKERILNLELRLVRFEESIPLSLEHIQKTLEGVVAELKQLRADHNDVVSSIKEDRARQEAKRAERERMGSDYDTGDHPWARPPSHYSTKSRGKRVAENAGWAAVAVTVAELVRLVSENLQ